MRTIIDVPAEQLEALDGICTRDRISRAEAVRRAIDLLVRQRGGAPARAYGLWRDRGIDGLRYERAMRDEWREPPDARGKSRRR